MDNVILKYFKSIVHFKSAQSFVKDISILEDAYRNYSYDYAVSVLSPITFKYHDDINKFGEHLNGVVSIKDTSLYTEKTETDLREDLLYLSRCIVIFAAVYMGIEENLKAAAVKIKSENLDLSQPNF